MSVTIVLILVSRKAASIINISALANTDKANCMANVAYIEEEVFLMKDKTFDFGVLENQNDVHYEPVKFSNLEDMKSYYKGYRYIGSYDIYNWDYEEDVKTEVFYDKKNKMYIGVFKKQD